MNISEIRAAVRQDLHDEDENNYRWTDDELDRHIRHAVSEFSGPVPYEQKATISTAAGSREIDISGVTGRVMVEAVEYPAGKFPRMYQRFSLWGDTLTLLGDEVPDGSDANIYYGKLHSIDEEGSTISARHEDLITAGAAGYAAVEWGIYAVNRVNAGGATTARDLAEWGDRRLSYFRQEIRRLGRRNRVRVGLLYAPYYLPVSKSTDYGP